MNFAESYGIARDQVTRQIYFNATGSKPLVYIFLFLTFAFLAYSIVKKVKIWRLGKNELRIDHPVKRIIAVIKYGILQKRVLEEGFPGLMHGLIFFGFFGLALVTAVLTIQEDITELIFSYKFLKGNPYLIWSLFADICGILVFTGLIIALVRRYIIKPERLDTKGTDNFTLILLLVVIITGYAAEAIRISLTGYPEFEVWSPVGYGLALLLNGFDRSTLETVHYGNWFVHVASSFLCIALFATGKLGHVLISIFNIFFSNLENENRDTKYALDIIAPEEFETAESFGVANVEDYTWKQLMDSDACTRCGRCQDNCPAWLTEKPLSPKKVINDIKDNMDERLPLLPGADSEGSSAPETTALIDGSVKSDEFWSCTNCGACMESCPVLIEHVPKMIGMRRHKVLMEGDMAPELQTTFMNLENNFNPYGFAFAERGDWLEEIKDLNIKTLAVDSNVDYLYFVGSAASYDKRNQKVAIAFMRIMKEAGIKVGILGAEEADSGDAALRGGNEYLFHALATRNLEMFKAYGVKKIICTCPHDYNVIKKEYKKFAKAGTGSDGNALEYDFEIFHHTEIINGLIIAGKIKLSKTLEETITFHDSCFLGRYNEIYDEPRNIISSIPGSKFVEMSRNHENSFCCGAGGARMFIEEHLGTRINQFRTRDAQSTGATKICTSCPFCMTMLSDGVTELEIDTIQVQDIAELVYESMGKTILETVVEEKEKTPVS